MTSIDREFLARMPKVELHLHLEGSIPLATLWRLIEKYNGTSEVKSLSALQQKFQYTNFPHFIETWVWKNNFLREYEDFTFIAEAVAHDLADQNIRYVEAFYSPGDFARHGLTAQGLTEALLTGLNRHRDKIEIKLIADLIRDFGPTNGERWLREIAEVKNIGVVGIGIGGSEHAFPPEVYESVYELAREFGFRTTAHAGEAAGAKGIWGAIKNLKVDRIGHGTRATEDASLISYLVESQIPVEMCPISNVRTGVVADLKAHPIRRFYDQGILLSVNTDDPKMFNTSLLEEYEALVEVFGFDATDIKRLVTNAVDSAWCDENKKMGLRCQIENAFSGLRN